MSSKRRAGTELNHENWNEDDDSDEIGEFKKASADELKQRVIKKAKRRTLVAGGGSGSSSNTDAPTKSTSIFSSFTGFGKSDTKPVSSAFSFLSSAAPSTKPVSSAFSFLSSATPSTLSTTPTKPASTTTTTSSTTSPPFSQFSFQAKTPNGQTTEPSSSSTTTPTSSSLQITSTSSTEGVTGGHNNNKSTTDFAKLKELNQSVAACISKRVNENPLCNLTPIFNDYEKYLKEIQSCNTNSTTETK